jgi:hypothetical protein
VAKTAAIHPQAQAISAGGADFLRADAARAEHRPEGIERRERAQRLHVGGREGDRADGERLKDGERIGERSGAGGDRRAGRERGCEANVHV